jgi:hypothetical protein
MRNLKEAFTPCLKNYLNCAGEMDDDEGKFEVIRQGKKLKYSKDEKIDEEINLDNY